MKKITFLLFALAAFSLSAQTTHNINWFFGAAPGTLIIDEGDTVNWIWTDGFFHSVTSDIGATDTFDSGILPNGSMYSRVFNTPGTNPYFCLIHIPMVGVIEVTEVLGIDDNEEVSFQYYPNPVKDYLRIDSNDVIDSVQLFTINGKMLMDAPVKNKSTNIYMGVFQSGIYFLTVRSGDKVNTIQVILDK
ncbi:MAG: T9SS type A sorting domain-containing protein [Bacteroidetes bacterium]|nr:T9SS type A sorting domain-containing protein [Bacteroidota bacterium]